ncbi:MAG: hypothetical protein JNK11_18180 [Alphaproteobacteria bacterium]|nr:hypothetical protein [Alphaproteobacteria bacterium]
MNASRVQILLVELACGRPESPMLGETLSGARLVFARGSADALLQLDGRALGAAALHLALDRTRLAERRAVRNRAAGRISPSAPWSSGS